MSTQQPAQQSRLNGSNVGFGGMCKYDIKDNRSHAQRKQDKDTHKRMVAASVAGDWGLYLQLQQSLN